MKRNKTIQKRLLLESVLLTLFFAVHTGVFAGKHTDRGYLGVSIERLTIDEKKKTGLSYGLIVTDVSEGKAADQAGIREDDIILSFDGEKMRRTGDLIEAVRNTEPGTEVKVVLFRDGKQMELPVTIGKLRRSHSFSWRDNDGYFFTGHRGVYLGVKLQELNEGLAGYFGVKPEEGVLILDVDEESPAEKAGIKAGDVIVKMDGIKIDMVEDVFDLLGEYEKDQKVDVELIRQKRKIDVKVTLEEDSGRTTINVFGNRAGDEDLHIMLPHLPHLSRFYQDDENMDILLDTDSNAELKEKIQEMKEGLRDGIKDEIKMKIDRSTGSYSI